MALAFCQDLEICGPKGRDCIEKNSAKNFNCSSTCEGIYADVQWVGKKIEGEMEDTEAEAVIERKIGKEVYKQIAELKKEIKLLKISGEGKWEELDKEKYKLLIAEYRKFKSKNVRHFRFNSGAIKHAFCKYLTYFIHVDHLSPWNRNSIKLDYKH